MAHRATVNLKVLAGVAKPNPKMGQTLGPLGINMMQFCKDFNALTGHFKPDVLMKVRLTAFTDRTFKFMIKPPETVWFFHRATKLDKFSANPGLINYGVVQLQQLYEIAKIKKELDPELKDLHIQKILDMVTCQLKSCGLRYTSTLPGEQYIDEEEKKKNEKKEKEKQKK